MAGKSAMSGLDGYEHDIRHAHLLAPPILQTGVRPAESSLGWLERRMLAADPATVSTALPKCFTVAPSVAEE